LFRLDIAKRKKFGQQKKKRRCKRENEKVKETKEKNGRREHKRVIEMTFVSKRRLMRGIF
jgi:hypothetical protein